MKIDFEKKLLKREKLYLLFSIIIVFIMNLYFIKYRNSIFNYDEFGYISIAQLMNGNIWRNITSDWQYYSWGYSIILSFLIKICSSPAIFYKSGVMINAVFNVFSFVLSYKLVKQLGIFRSNSILMLCCLSISLYSSNLLYVNVLMPECLLSFLLWVLLYLIFLQSRVDSSVISFFTALTTVFSFAVHQRCIVYIVAVLILYLYMYHKKIIETKSFLVYSMTLFCILPCLKITDYIQEVLWNSSEIINSNSMQGQVDKVGKIFSSFNTIVNYIPSAIAKTGYMTISSVGLFLLGCWGAVIILRRKKNISCINVVLTSQLIWIMMFIISIISIGIAQNETYLLYGRYMEAVSGPVLLLGMLSLESFWHSDKRIIGIIVIMLFLSIFISFSLENIKEHAIYLFNMICVSEFYNPVDKTIQIEKMAIFSLCMFLICTFIKKFKYETAYLIFIILLTCFWIHTSHAYVADQIATERYHDNELVNIINEIGENQNIYYYIEQWIYDDYLYMANLQFELNNKELLYFNQLNLIPPDAKILICPKRLMKNFNNYNIVFSNSYIVMLDKKGCEE